MMRALLDMDGVLVNFVKGVCQKWQEPDPYLDERNHGNYFIQRILGIGEHDFQHQLDYTFWRELEWMPDGQEILRLVYETFGKDNVVICSYPSGNDCTDAKLQWIARRIPELRRQFVITPEKAILAGPNTVLIDDHDEAVRDFGIMGRAILVPRPWNSLHGTNTLQHLQAVLPNVK